MARTTPADGDKDEKIMIVTATSGDTGKAALAGFADAAGTGITVFYPEGKVSQVQELQMTTQSGSNVNVCAVKGNFDDAQSAVKRIFGDKELAERLADDSHVVLSSANSINVGRLVPQVVYYFSAYAQLLERQVINVGDEVEFVVPTGNFGDILAGYYAKLLGLPVKHLVVASDKNNVLFDFLTSGTYNRQRPFFQTISPSMDILISSNLERMLYYMSDKDTRLISMLMNDLNQWGAYEVPEPMMKKIRSIFGTGWADENQVREMIADCWNKNHYVIDPHTACGYYVMQQMHLWVLTRPAPISNAWTCLPRPPAPPLRPRCAVLKPPTCVSITSSKSTAWKDSSSRPRRRCKVSNRQTATIHRRIGCPRYAGGRFSLTLVQCVPERQENHERSFSIAVGRNGKSAGWTRETEEGPAHHP